MSSSGQMSRRRFLAVVGGAGGALGVAGLGGWRLLGGREGSASTVGGPTVDPRAETVEIQPGFVDATVWNGELLTLRANPIGTGIVLHSETTGADHPVDAPDGFTARCVGTLGEELAICGHQVAEAGSITIDAGPRYEDLALHADVLSEVLRAQPDLPEAISHTHVYVEYAPSMLIAPHLDEWTLHKARVSGVEGGSIGAIFSDSQMLALDSYAIAEIPDSIVASVLVPAHGFRDDELLQTAVQFPIDHGTVWGRSHDGTNELLIVSDHLGTRIYGVDGRTRLDIGRDSHLLGLDAEGEDSRVAIRLADGRRELREYSGADESRRTKLEPASRIIHRLSGDVTISATASKSPIVAMSQAPAVGRMTEPA